MDNLNSNLKCRLRSPRNYGIKALVQQICCNAGEDCIGADTAVNMETMEVSFMEESVFLC